MNGSFLTPCRIIPTPESYLSESLLMIALFLGSAVFLAFSYVLQFLLKIEHLRGTIGPDWCGSWLGEKVQEAPN